MTLVKNVAILEGLGYPEPGLRMSFAGVTFRIALENERQIEREKRLHVSQGIAAMVGGSNEEGQKDWLKRMEV